MNFKQELEARGFKEQDDGKFMRQEPAEATENGPAVLVTAWDGTGIDSHKDAVLVGFYDTVEEKFCELGFKDLRAFFKAWDTKAAGR